MDRFERECQIAMQRATDYAGWKEAALELDRHEGADGWKNEDASDDYDWRLIRSRLRQIRQYRAESGSIVRWAFDSRVSGVLTSWKPFLSGFSGPAGSATV